MREFDRPAVMNIPHRATMVLGKGRFDAIYSHLFDQQRRSIEGDTGPWVNAREMPDTDPKAKGGWAVTGSWGVADGGSRWPARVLVEDLH